MLYQISELSTALILERLYPQIMRKCVTPNDHIVFLKRLCWAGFDVYGQEQKIDEGFKHYILLSFSMSSLFVHPSFTESIASKVCDDILFPAKDEATDTIMRAIGFKTNDSDYSRSAQNDYFEMELEKLFEREFGSGLKALPDLFHQNMKLPDRKEAIEDHLSSSLPVIKKKRGQLNNISIREFLTYYCIKVFEELQVGLGYITFQLMEQFYNQVEEVSSKILPFSFDEVTPEHSIQNNHTTDRIFVLKEKYFDWLLS
jgi:hypothetical protein